jgi:hypothetical protein
LLATTRNKIKSRFQKKNLRKTSKRISRKFQVTVLLHQKYKKSWTDALSLALDYQQGDGDVDLDLLFSMI